MLEFGVFCKFREAYGSLPACTMRAKSVFSDTHETMSSNVAPVSPLVKTLGERSCPTVAATPQSVRAALTKERDLFADQGVAYLYPFLNVSDRPRLACELLETWGAALGLTAAENASVPLIIYAASIWGIGMGGGYVLAFNVGGAVPAAMHGARGSWIASTAGLGAAALGLTLFLVWVLRQQQRTATSAAG